MNKEFHFDIHSSCFTNRFQWWNPATCKPKLLLVLKEMAVWNLKTFCDAFKNIIHSKYSLLTNATRKTGDWTKPAVHELFKNATNSNLVKWGFPMYSNGIAWLLHQVPTHKVLKFAASPAVSVKASKMPRDPSSTGILKLQKGQIGKIISEREGSSVFPKIANLHAMNLFWLVLFWSRH